jgi:hypothetical protein
LALMRLQAVRELGIRLPAAARIPAMRVAALARLAGAAKASAILRLPVLRRLATLVAFVHCLEAEAALNQLRADRFEVRDEDVARLSPLLQEHINMLGRYSFSVPEAVAKGQLRPLRNPASDE